MKENRIIIDRPALALFSDVKVPTTILKYFGIPGRVRLLYRTTSDNSSQYKLGIKHSLGGNEVFITPEALNPMEMCFCTSILHAIGAATYDIELPPDDIKQATVSFVKNAEDSYEIKNYKIFINIHSKKGNEFQFSSGIGHIDTKMIKSILTDIKNIL